MEPNPDFKDLFKILNEEQVKYLVVGAYAVIFYTEPRFTKDLDIWVQPTTSNARKVWKALTRFGAPLEDVTPDDFTNRELIYQIGIDPNRIDIIMEVSGQTFKKAWENKSIATYGDQTIFILSKDDLILAKKASNRPQDRIDLENLMTGKKP